MWLPLVSGELLQPITSPAGQFKQGGEAGANPLHCTKDGTLELDLRRQQVKISHNYVQVEKNFQVNAFDYHEEHEDLARVICQRFDGV